MKFGTFTATAFLAIAAVGITAATANANPSAPTPAVAKEISSSGTDQGVGYKAVLSDFSRVLTTSVENGTFQVTDNNSKVTLTSDRGDVVAQVPLAYQISGTPVRVAQQISDNGHTLVLEPTMTAKEVGEMQPVSSMVRLANEVNQNVVGMVVGGLLGGLIGTIVGVGFFSIITGPIGLLVGAIAGGYATGGQPFLDAVMNVVSGQP
jgi:hypothetical protein